MKRNYLFIFAIIFMILSLGLAGCSKRPKQGEAVVTVTGKIGNTNRGDSYILHQLDFATNATTASYSDPWIKDTIVYKGLLLKDILKIVKPDSGATEMVFKNTNAQTYSVSIGDAQSWDIMLARWANDQLLFQDNGYPSKLVFPEAAKEEYPAEMWAWWVNSIEIR
ncbi:MAG: molybdopterin-dependent oxidoreductase [Anaerolineaceae bacterium]|nr:molybdopterin-dependent oxidoreductase [Anaerolineaceae bacterium]